MSGLLNSIKNLGAGNPCVVEEPYEYVEENENVEEEAEEDKGSGGGSKGKKEKSMFSLGIRTGANFSNLRATYDNGYNSIDGAYGLTMGLQTGLAFDFALSDVFHVQPGLMYIQKGAEDRRLRGEALTSHYVEIPILLSLKLSALRLNAGPYFGLCAGSSSAAFRENDIGISAGLGFDIGMFYMGAFYDYGLMSVNSYNYMEHYNRSVGFNLGVNL